MTAHASIDAGDPIGILMPWTGDEERKLRNGLLRAQQFSATRAIGCSSERARGLFWLINAAAAEQVTAPATIEDLQDLHRGLLSLSAAANMFERRECGE